MIFLENEFPSSNSVYFIQSGLAPADTGEDQDLIPILEHMGLVQIVLTVYCKGHLSTDSKFFGEIPECWGIRKFDTGFAFVFTGKMIGEDAEKLDVEFDHCLQKRIWNLIFIEIIGEALLKEKFFR